MNNYLKACDFVSNELNIIQSQYDTEKASFLFSTRNEYVSKKDLYQAVGEECVRFITDPAELQNYIASEQSHDSTKECKSSIRLYRGQKEAAWLCRSTLLRTYRKYFLHQGKAVCFKDFFFFLVHNHSLWEKMLSPKELDEATILEGLEKMPRNKDGYLKEMRDITKKATKDLEWELNASWREIIAQHYGFPTSLIDFTKDINIALFFATKGYKQTNNTERESLNNYINIIHFDTDNVTFNWENSRENTLDRIIAASMDNPICMNAFKSFKARDNKDGDSLTLCDLPSFMYIDPTSAKRPLENIRIKKQKGVLVSLGKYPHECLEDAFNEYRSHDARIPKLHYTLIHKSLIPEIEVQLKNVCDTSLGFY